MNFIICIIIVAYLCLLRVHCRSLQMDSDVLSGLQKEGNLNHDHERGSIFSWKKLKPLLKREMQRIRNVKDMATMFNQKSTESASSIHSAEYEHLSSEHQNLDKNEGNSFESQIITSNSIKSELTQNHQNKEVTTEYNVTEGFANSTTHDDILETDPLLTTFDFPDNVISDILNQSGDSIVFQALNDNSSKSFEFDEATLLTKGGQIAMLQEVSTVGFELLIDSETKKNLILTELLSSQSNLIDDSDFTESILEENYGAVTTMSIQENENEMQETTTNGDKSDLYNITEFSTDEIGITNTESDSVDSFGKDNLISDSIDEQISNNSDISELDADEFEVENTESSNFADLFLKDNVADVLTEQTTNNPDITEINTGKFEIENTELNFADSVLKDNVADVLNEQTSNNSDITEINTTKFEIENNESNLADSFQNYVTEVLRDDQTSSNSDIASLTNDIENNQTILTGVILNNATEVSTYKPFTNTSDIFELNTNEITSDFTDSFQDIFSKVSIDELTLNTSNFTELDADEIRTENVKPNFAESFQKTNITELLKDEPTLNASSVSLYIDEIISEFAELFQDNVTKVSTDEQTLQVANFTEQGAGEIETEDNKSNLGNSFLKNNVTEVLKDEPTSNASSADELHTEETISELVESFQDDNVTKVSSDEQTLIATNFAELDADELETEDDKSNLGNSFQKDNATEVLIDYQTSTVFGIAEIQTKDAGKDLTEPLQGGSITEITGADPKCPDPGWCIFWFIIHEDTCAKDSHCHGSLICCMWGCSKMCIDPDNLF